MRPLRADISAGNHAWNMAITVFWLLAGWWQLVLSLVRLHSMLHGTLFILATALMLVSMVAAVCTCALTLRTIVAFAAAPSPAAETASDSASAAEPSTVTAAVQTAPLLKRQAGVFLPAAQLPFQMVSMRKWWLWNGSM